MTQPITLSATLEDPTPNATGLIKVRFTTPDRTVFAWVPEEAIRRSPAPVFRFGPFPATEDAA